MYQQPAWAVSGAGGLFSLCCLCHQEYPSPARALLSAGAAGPLSLSLAKVDKLYPCLAQLPVSFAERAEFLAPV